MKPINEYIDELLANKFAGELTAAEEAKIEEWLKADPENAKYMAEMAWVWEYAEKGQASLPGVDTEKALEKVKNQIQSRKRQISIFYWRAAAAAVAAVFAAIWFFNQPARTGSEEIIASKQEIRSDILQDGSQITLNRNSGLIITQGFNKKERRTRLQGEAYFKVKEDAERPFIVEVEKLEIQLSGSEFNIFENLVGNTVEVAVMEGKVRLTSGKQIEYLAAGESAVYEKVSGKITKKGGQHPNTLSYQNKRFSFDATPLKNVAEQVGKVYGVEIGFKNPKLEDCLLSARYDNLPIDQIVTLIAETFNFKVEKSGSKIFFDGIGCEE